MTITDILHQFIRDLRNPGWRECVAVIAGILSVWFSRSENILVYPTGLVNTIAYIYLSLKSSLLGEASVNLYYTALNIYGWILWAKKDDQQQNVLRVTFSSPKEKKQQLLFFGGFHILLFVSLTGLKKRVAP